MRNSWRGNFFQVLLFFLIIFCTFHNWIFVAASILFVPWQQEKSGWHLFLLLLACCNYNRNKTMLLRIRRSVVVTKTTPVSPSTKSPKILLLKCTVSLYLFRKSTQQVMFRCWITKVQLLGLLQAALHGGLDKGLNGQWQLGLIDSIINWCRRCTEAVLSGQLESTVSYC